MIAQIFSPLFAERGATIISDVNQPPPQPQDARQPHYHFVTGRLAEAALREVVAAIAQTRPLQYTIGVMPITVAALMTPRWLLRHLVVPHQANVVVLPGYLEQHVDELRRALGVEVRCGPRDLRRLPEWFGGQRIADAVLDEHSIEIIAEINHAPRLTAEQLLTEAQSLRDAGADVIDIGCDPSSRWTTIGDAFKRLTDAGIVTSVDTFDPWEAAQACGGGATLVLSVNQSNRQAAADWGVEVVAIPETPADLPSLDTTVDFLSRRGVPMRLDPILEPIGLGFTTSLLRYAETRRRYPQLPMMMGIGNLTELTDCDSAGINLMLLAICQELQIDSVLTTQVINWARSSVRECDLARRLVHHSVRRQTPPKRLSDALVMLRDPQLQSFSDDVLRQLAADLRDNHYRIFAQHGAVHLISAGLHLVDDDPFRLFAALLAEPQAENVDASHAFYLGYEMAKAVTALTLGKQYEQDQALRWGHLTRTENMHRLPRRRQGRNR